MLGEGMKGYKYTVCDKNVYIITLDCFNDFIDPDAEFLGYPVCFYTTNCQVIKIKNVNTGEEAEEVKGIAYYPFTYRKGEKIETERIFFCKSLTALYFIYLFRDKTGRILDRYSHGKLQHETWRNNDTIFPDTGSMESIGKFIEYARKNGIKISFDDEKTLIYEYYNYLDKINFAEQ